MRHRYVAFELIFAMVCCLPSVPAGAVSDVDKGFAIVVFVSAFRCKAITEERIVPGLHSLEPRNERGWIGCTINLSELPSVRIVEPGGIDRRAVREEWLASAIETRP